MNILHIVSGSLNGGAARGAYWLHKGLIDIGIDSVLISNKKKEISDKSVISLANSFAQKAKFEILPFIGRLPLNFYKSNQIEIFDTGFEGIDITKLAAYKNADIIHLHWINGFVSVRTLKKVRKPIIWTIRDMWPFTGGCHYSGSCEKFKNECGKCPVLESNCSLDLSRIVNKYKKIYLPKNIHIVGISNWISHVAKQSTLFKDLPIRTIFNNIDTDQFYPIEKKIAKDLLNLPTGRKIILVGAQYLWHSYKGFDLFLEAINELNFNKIHVVLFGRSKFSENQLKSIPFSNLGYISDSISLRLVYSAADVFVGPSIVEAFGKTLVEAMACGTPVVCFDATGPADIVDHKITGYKAEPYCPQDLAYGIDWVFSLSKENEENLRIAARNRAVELFDSKVIALQYLKLYRECIS